MATGWNQNGVILSIDMLVENDYCQVVFPLVCGVHGSSASNYSRMCYNAVQAFKGHLTEFLDLLSEKAFVIGIGAEAMINGRVPYRENYTGDTSHQGTRGAAGDVEPSSIGVVLDYYADPGDIPPGTRTVVAHNTVPGIAEGDTGGNIISDTLIGLWQAFVDDLITNGWDYTDAGPSGDTLKWERAMSTIRGAIAQAIRVAVVCYVKRIVGSVKGRLAPPRR